jgi:hypothetical protein
MRKLVMFALILFSVNAIADSNMNSAIMSSLQKQASNDQATFKMPMIIYGGQDISRPLIANANIPVLDVQSNFIG